MRDVIQRVAVGPDRGRDISSKDAEQVMTAILDKQIDDVQVAVFLIALRMKRESMDEFKGLFNALQSSIQTIDAGLDDLVCLADPFDGYLRHLPMTPFIPSVLAEFGLSTLMHGVESVGPKHGITASKVYQLAGIDTLQNTESVAARLSEIGWGYVDQSSYAPSLFSLNAFRDRIVKRTALTTLERLLLPIRARNTHLVLGYVHKAYPEIYMSIAHQAGYQSTLLIKGVEGGVAPALNKPLRRYFLEHDAERGLSVNDHKEVTQSQSLFSAKSAAFSTELTGDDAVKKCLEVGLDALSGKPSIAQQSLCFASAQILHAHKHADSLASAVEKVQDCLDNGDALTRFKRASK